MSNNYYTLKRNYRRLEDSVLTIRKILSAERYAQTHVIQQRLIRTFNINNNIIDSRSNFGIADDVQHDYEDKFLLTDFIINLTLASQLNTLSKIGITPEFVLQLKKLKLGQLRLTIETECRFVKQVYQYSH